MAGTSRIPNDFGKKEGSTSTGTMSGGSLGQQAQDLGQRAKEAASNVAGRAQETASAVADKAKDLASQAGEKTDEAISTVGEKMSSWAGSLRQSAPQEGVIGSAATAVADRLDAGGQYLQEHDLSDMVTDFESVIRRHPLQALCIGFGVGCLIGLALRRR